jgi:FSR family fosmidomycin resistance protein-like MFS transporter
VGETSTGLRGQAGTLALLSVSHAAVDATCTAVLFASLLMSGADARTGLAAVVVYNVAAFALQPLVGLGLDRLTRPQAWAGAGALAVAASGAMVAVSPVPLAAAVLAGVGNAVFHVGGGIVALRMAPGRATAPGIYVAPGAVGLAIGVAVGRAGGPFGWLAAGVAALGVMMLATRPRSVPVAQAVREPSVPASLLERVVLALLLVIAVRAFVGSALAFPWKSAPALLAWLVAATAVGKAAGGVLADAFGRLRVGVGALVAAIPLLVLGAASPVAGIAGVFLVNATMPITLVAVADAMPERPGFAFGLTCLALIAGTFPLYADLGSGLVEPLPLAIVLVGTAGILWWALRPWSHAARRGGIERGEAACGHVD